MVPRPLEARFATETHPSIQQFADRYDWAAVDFDSTSLRLGLNDCPVFDIFGLRSR